MASPESEIPCEFPSRRRKRQSEKEEEEDSNDSEESDFSIDYDSDDPSFEILEGKADPKIWKQYYKEWRQSEGFDITVIPGTFMGGIEPIYDHLTNPKKKQEFTLFCELAIQDFNSKNDDNKIYTFVEIVHVTASYAAGTWYYLTFNARDTTIDAAAADAIKTFQAAVWKGIDESIRVHFCRLKKFVTDEGKKKKKKKHQQDGKADAEQDKPCLLKSSLPGLIIEELSKGKPRGKKAYTGFKVGVRYTGKLKDNEKIFDTNVGEEDPLEFRLASDQVILGWQYGLVDMRVGDKRRITIPPDLGYAFEWLFSLHCCDNHPLFLSACWSKGMKARLRFLKSCEMQEHGGPQHGPKLGGSDLLEREDASFEKGN